MTELNRFITNQHNLIKSLQEVPLKNFINKHNEQATWDDLAWRYLLPSGKGINFLFHKSTVTFTTFNSKSDLNALEPLFKHLAMAYAIQLNCESTSLCNKRDKHASARQFLSLCKVNPANLNNRSLVEVFSNGPKKNYFKAFIEWLKKEKLIPGTITTPKQIGAGAGPAGYDIAIKNKNKIPSAKVLMALGAITYEVIPVDRKKWKVHALDSQRNAFICMMTSLAMASPNRVFAEQTILAKQSLKTNSQTVNGKKTHVHYLDWPGSKGFGSYHNHILDSMSECVERCLDYINIACEPGRAIARFYENPKRPLKEVLGDFRPAIDKIKALNIDINKSVHLIHLGYILGFYDDGSQKVRVQEGVSGSKIIRRKGYSNISLKPIQKLTSDDRLLISVGCDHTKYLFGAKYPTGLISPANYKPLCLTVEEFQKFWINHIKSCIPTFPIGFNASDRGQINYSQALFCFTGSQLYGGNTPYSGGLSHFAIAPISSLSGLFQAATSKGHNPNFGNIFKKFGFADDFFFSSHQLRHWLNDTAEKNGVSHSIINLWSGRSSPEQLMHYIHRTPDEKASEISDIIFSEKGVSIAEVEGDLNVRIKSQAEYELITNTASAVTSVGLCTQNLQFNPCTYLNDFITQCTLCPSSCHIHGDSKSIELLNKDLKVQTERLNTIIGKSNFSVSEAMQNWYTIHYRNTAMLEELIRLMKDVDIEKGSIIRIISDKKQIKITNLSEKNVENRPLCLPDAESSLRKLLDSAKPKPEVNDLLDIIKIMELK